MTFNKYIYFILHYDIKLFMFVSMINDSVSC